MVKLSDDDRRSIAEAVARAEAQTSGEICCVLVEEASHYREIPILSGALVALLLPPLLLWLGLRPLALADTISGWAAGQGHAAERHVLVALGAYAVAQAALFAAVVLIAHIPAVRRVLTPAFVKRHRMRLSARKYFSSLSAKTGDVVLVMIYASRLDRMVEIVVSDAAAKACDPSAWSKAAEVIGTSVRAGSARNGFVQAIEICGAELARRFPPAAGGPANQVPDTLLEG